MASDGEILAAVAAVPYCCHLGPAGEECREAPKHLVYKPPMAFDNYTHACDSHRAEMSGPGDVVEPL
jgi:hypothetical protein